MKNRLDMMQTIWTFDLFGSGKMVTTYGKEGIKM